MVADMCYLGWEAGGEAWTAEIFMGVGGGVVEGVS
jgi:hypothetical protein